MSRKLYNPKAAAPSIYIASWLSQVSIKLLSLGAKMLYGRLSQWVGERGISYRSITNLAIELGCKERTIEKYLNELKTVGLIGTFHPQAGGVNYYEFYEHEWMFAPIAKELCYASDPPHNHAVPPAHPCGTLPHTRADINIKEIKETIHTYSDEFFLEKELFTDAEQQRKAIVMRKLCLEDEKAKTKHSQLETDKSFKDVLDECVSHYATQQKPQLVSPQRFQSWIERISRFKKQEVLNNPKNKSIYPTKEERATEELKIKAREQKAFDEKRKEIEDVARLSKLAEKDRKRVPGRPQGLRDLLGSLGLQP